MKIHEPKGKTGYDPLWKMCPTFTELTKNFEEVYALEEILTVDEATVYLKGAFVFRSMYEIWYKTILTLWSKKWL
jgi:hypothetical protein